MGSLLNRLSQVAINTFIKERNNSHYNIMQSLNSALTGTLGAAIALLRIKKETNEAIFTGIGNIRGHIIPNQERTRGFISLPGIVGYNLASIKSFYYSLQPGDFVILASDGLKSSFTMNETNYCDASLLAGLIYRDFNRGNDDTTVVVFRY